jgi:glycosyltransferase involved in cell wall biosynthesis
VARRFPGKLLRLLRPWLSVQTFTGPLDLFHYTDFSRPPLAKGTPFVATLHDVTFLLSKEYHREADREALEAMTRATLRDARLVLTDSEAARRDLVERAGADPARVRAVPLAAEARFFEPVGAEDLAAVRARHRLPARFLLAVGTIEPRKNHARLVRALARCRERLPLVVAGKRGWLTDAFDAAARASPVEVRALGHAPDADLPALYRLAEAVAYPSLAEGFGLPVVEAMACGAPVVTSNRSSLAEVAGNACVLVDPEDEAAIADGIDRARRGRARLAELGPRRARELSWEKTARATLAAYREAVRA